MSLKHSGIVSAVGELPASLLRRLLKKSDLPFSYSNKDSLINKISEFINENKLDAEYFLTELRLAEECGSKNIHLRKLTNLSIVKDEKKLNDKLEELSLKPQSSGLETIKLPPEPTLNYINISDDEIRLKYSETQQSIKFSKTTFKFDVDDKTNVVVISINRKNGVFRIYFDSPNDSHSHQTIGGHVADSMYFNYYRNIVRDIFGNSMAINLNKRVTVVQRMKPAICYVRNNTDINEYDTRATLRSDNLLDDPEYVAKINREKDVIVNDTSSLLFLDSVPNSTLVEPLGAIIIPQHGIIKIATKCLASEVDYVISTLTKT